MLSELIVAFKEKDDISVRRLVAAAGVSSPIIQEIGSGETKSMTVKTLQKVLESIGYEIAFQRKSQPRK